METDQERSQRNSALMLEMSAALRDEMTEAERARLHRLNMLEADRVITDRYRLTVVRDRLAYRAWMRVVLHRPEWNKYTRGSFEWPVKLPPRSRKRS